MREAYLEQAEARVEAERDRSVSRIQASLKEQGSDECVDCGGEIEHARRLAAPFAQRCVSCQTTHERISRRVW